ncbi:MAG: rhomboid family intramembrane serine protease [Bacteroidetes bacterium]|nr:rhomboid family intramembrane serine protease [Bacteroidota bacterium]
MSYQEFRPGRFNQIPLVVKNILIINVILYAANMLFSNVLPLDKYLDLYFFKSHYFKPHQFITYMFMHSKTDPTHIIFNMLAVYMFGSILENLWGSKRFLNFYILCGLGAAAAQYAVDFYHYREIINSVGGTLSPEMDSQLKYYYDGGGTLGASGAVFGLLAAFAMMFPNTYLYLYFAIPIKAKYFVLGYAVIEFFSGSFGLEPGVAHFAHLGGAAVGAIIVLIWRRNRSNFY